VLKELAAKKKQITVAEFSPWQIRGVDELTLQFFAQVHDHLGGATQGEAAGGLAKREKMWMALARLSGAGTAALKIIGGAAALSDQGKSFAPVLMAAAGVSEHFATLLQSAAEDTRAKANKSRLPINAEEARRELAMLFSDPELPSVLVVMDDFDRLTSDEIQTLVRLIKANANFPGLNYLILCDPEQLALALDPVAANKGKEFLEKIVQNPIRLPAPDGDSILRQLGTGLENIAKRTAYPLGEHLDRLRFYFQNFFCGFG
jgi:KAP family P-loop domain